ncbi:hypothetical protein KC318_g2205 [Hortaea werneckii]|nr:hypothetical protein KC334_g2295 [Hortaea werneckii]KAI7022149.1 hypothetical protein KC355_g2163 [Hortaea werneckii]KAI7200080.1 hypothetical protein KC324_g2915 [Hortaea werneckii]KAI7591215.1 hypothetical protein KC316_g2973 [Hortaea werneckii]KAI7673501.1 hypothetical protein KC318_g2205 [Hortaea werneckii]
MSSMEVRPANEGSQARDLLVIFLHGDDEVVDQETRLHRMEILQPLSRFFDILLVVGNDFNLHSADGLEVTISVPVLIGLNTYVVTQRYFLQKPTCGGNIAGPHTFDSMTRWDQHGVPHDGARPWPESAAQPTGNPVEHETQVRTSVDAQPGTVLVTARRANPTINDYDATPLPRTEPLTAFDPPESVDMERRDKGSKVKDVTKVVIRDDDVVYLRGPHGKPEKFEVTIRSNVDGEANTPVASSLGCLPLPGDATSSLQASQQAQSSANNGRPSVHGNAQARHSHSRRDAQSQVPEPSELGDTGPTLEEQVDILRDGIRREIIGLQDFDRRIKQGDTPDGRGIARRFRSIRDLHQRKIKRRALKRRLSNRRGADQAPEVSAVELVEDLEDEISSLSSNIELRRAEASNEGHAMNEDEKRQEEADKAQICRCQQFRSEVQRSFS